jgi:hypothetical protein
VSRQIVRLLDKAAVTRTMTIVAILSLLASLWVGLQQYQLADCLADYTKVNNERSRILTDVGADERAAERRRDDALDRVFLDPSLQTPAGERTAEERQRVLHLFGDYLSAARAVADERAKADAARRANPVPPAPDVVCD